jgi:Tol biopolymer transport system component
MADLRERFAALDALDVPDVLSRARTIGPRPPDPERTPTYRRVGPLVLALALAVVAIVLFARVLDHRARPANTPTPTEFGSPTDRAVIGYTGVDPRDNSGDLVARDPDTGAVRTLVTAAQLSPPGGIGPLIGSAAWSADGRWVAFEIVACGGGVGNAHGLGGLWVTNGAGVPRQLTRPCEDPAAVRYDYPWAWSPTRSELAVVRASAGGESLYLVDAATGDRTDLGETVGGEVGSLAWSPDGRRIAYVTYGVAGRRGALHSVAVDGRHDSVLATLPGVVYWLPGESGGLQWSPDGSHIAIEVWDGHRYDLYVADADGSHLLDLAEHIGVLDGEGEGPDMSWSPDGSAIAWVSSAGAGARYRLQIWTASASGDSRTKLFESAPVLRSKPLSHLGPVWSPDGTQVAFEHDGAPGRAAWLVANADGSGDVHPIDELRYRSWRGGWYFCGCYG